MNRRHESDLILELQKQLASCAAGQWRYDVENAEAGEWYWVTFGEGDYETCTRSPLGQWTNRVGCYVPIPKAIAAINPPEVKP